MPRRSRSPASPAAGRPPSGSPPPITASKWTNRTTKNVRTPPVKDLKFADLPAMLLRVFRDDADIPRDVINAKIDETFVPRGKIEMPEKGKFEEWKAKKVKELRQRVFPAFPDKFVKAEEVPFPGALVLRAEGHRDSLIIRGKGDKKGDTLSFWVIGSESQSSAKSRFANLFGFMPFGGLGSGWTRKSPPNYVERSHLLIGRTMDQGKLNDVIAGFNLLQDSQGDCIVVGGNGIDGILAAYAALFEPSIKEV